MHVRTSVERDTVLRRRLGDSPGAAGQVRRRKGGPLSQRSRQRQPLPAVLLARVRYPEPAQALSNSRGGCAHHRTRCRPASERRQYRCRRNDAWVGVLYNGRQRPAVRTHTHTPNRDRTVQKRQRSTTKGYKTLDVHVEWSHTPICSTGDGSTDPVPFTQSVILPPIFNDMMAMVRENQFMRWVTMQKTVKQSFVASLLA